MATLVDANTNRLSGFGYSYDGNGNLLTMPQQSASMTYDGSNRMVKFTNQNDTESYQYAPDNKRVWRSKGCSYQSVVDGSTQVAPALTFYSVFGQKLGDYCYPPGGGQVVEENVHFWGRIVAKGDAGGSLAALATDRLHSKGDGSTFFPYGETKSGATITGDSFATYSRDWSGLDYADQRWYAPGVGRFTTVDPLEAISGGTPNRINRYAYASSQPIDRIDADGLCDVMILGIRQGTDNQSSEILEFNTATNSHLVYPYGFGLIPDLMEVVGQPADFNQAFMLAYEAIMDAAAQSTGPINIIAYSGGAQAFTAAFGALPDAVRNRIGNITYISPAFVGQNPAINSSTTFLFDEGLFNIDAYIGSEVPTNAGKNRYGL